MQSGKIYAKTRIKTIQVKKKIQKTRHVFLAIITFVLLLNSNLFSQELNAKEKEESLRYLSEKLNYANPSDNETGKINISFNVLEGGKITDVEVSRKRSELSDPEHFDSEEIKTKMAQLLESMGIWNKGTISGIKMELSLPFRFETKKEIKPEE